LSPRSDVDILLRVNKNIVAAEAYHIPVIIVHMTDALSLSVILLKQCQITQLKDKDKVKSSKTSLSVLYNCWVNNNSNMMDLV
jgi:hypothetical protein